MRKKITDEGIICPHCGKLSNGQIIDTRLVADGKRRRRLCEFCGKRYTTLEKSVISKYCYVEGK